MNDFETRPQVTIYHEDVKDEEGCLDQICGFQKSIYFNPQVGDYLYFGSQATENEKCEHVYTLDTCKDVAEGYIIEIEHFLEDRGYQLYNKLYFMNITLSSKKPNKEIK